MIKKKIISRYYIKILEKVKSGAGFTLIEILVAMSVLLVIGSILISILISSLRGTNKVNSIDNVRRNGNYALEQMGKMIRYSQSFNGVSDDPSLNPASFTTNCIPPVVPALTPTPTPSLYHYIRITGFDGGQTILSCVQNSSPLNVPPEIASRSALDLTAPPVYFIDPVQDSTTIDIVSCTITCTQDTVVSPPTVTIQFELMNRTASGLSENKYSIPFQTSVTVRNY